MNFASSTSTSSRRAQVTVTLQRVYVINGGGECEAEVYFDIDVNGTRDANPWGKNGTDANNSTVSDCDVMVDIYHSVTVVVNQNDPLTIRFDMQEKDGRYHLAAYYTHRFTPSEWSSSRGQLNGPSVSPGGDYGDGVFEVYYSISVQWLN